MNKAHHLRPLRGITGYGPELADALERYSTASPDAAGHAQKAAILHAWKQWMSRCPHAEHLCYADITFFSDSTFLAADSLRVQDALTIVITPAGRKREDENNRDYLEAFKEKYLPTGHTMAPHEVFAAGLPILTSGKGPDTASELNEFWETLPDGEHVESALFIRPILALKGKRKTRRPRSVNFYLSVMKTYEDKGSFTQAQAKEVSTKPISQQFAKWVDVFRKERESGRLKSSVGSLPNWLVAAPIGTRNDSDPRDYALVACVFLAFDSDMVEEDVSEAMRYILLHLYEANATAWANRRGEIRGKDSGLISARHELKTVVATLGPKLSDNALNLLRVYFSEVMGMRERDRMASEMDLAHTINQEADRAAQIEKLCELARFGDVGNEDESVIDTKMREHSETVRRVLTVDSISSYAFIKADPEVLEWFRLALLSALRNALRHTFEPGSRNQSVRVSVESHEHKGLVVIVNSFDRKPKPVFEKDHGTLKTLRNYARLYLMDSRSVRLEHVASSSVSQDRTTRETWRTILPIPEGGEMIS